MAQRKTEENNPLNQVLRLIEQLSPSDREKLSQRLDGKSWGDRWRRLEHEIEQNRIAKGLSLISEEEVYEEFRAHRREAEGKGAQSSN